MQFNKNSYRPLPKGLTIKESSIHGLGLFATKDWEVGQYMGITHVHAYASYLLKELTDEEWIRTPLGGFINHNNDPNCFVGYQSHHHRGAYASKPIKAGQEVTTYYSLTGYKHWMDLKEGL